MLRSAIPYHALPLKLLNPKILSTNSVLVPLGFDIALLVLERSLESDYGIPVRFVHHVHSKDPLLASSLAGKRLYAAGMGRCHERDTS